MLIVCRLSIALNLQLLKFANTNGKNVMNNLKYRHLTYDHIIPWIAY